MMQTFIKNTEVNKITIKQLAISFVFLLLTLFFPSCKNTSHENPEIQAGSRDLTEREQAEMDRILKEDGVLEFTPSIKSFGPSFMIELLIVKNKEFITEYNRSIKPDEQFEIIKKHRLEHIPQGRTAYILLSITNPKETSVLSADFHFSYHGTKQLNKISNKIIWDKGQTPKNVARTSNIYIPLSIKQKKATTTPYLIKVEIKDTVNNLKMELEKSLPVK